MTRLKALNDSSSDEGEDENEEKETIEAQEERAFAQYNKALELRHLKKFSEAEHLLISLLDGDFLGNVSSTDKMQSAEGLARPAIALKYACLKNLGDVLVLQGRLEDGLSCLIQAVELDTSDVTVWYRLGTVALQTNNFPLASYSYQSGLDCNPRHWPCLDALLPVLYAVEDYLGCLLLATRALQLDPDYPQVIALCRQIVTEQPSLHEYFKLCFSNEVLDALLPGQQLTEAQDLVLHAQSLQEQFRLETKHQWMKDVPPPECGFFFVCLSDKSWFELGRCLLKSYNTLMNDSNSTLLHPIKLSFSSSLDESRSDVAKRRDCAYEFSDYKTSAMPLNVDVEKDVGDFDSEHDVKGDDQTEEDATEASGHELEEDHPQKDVLTAPEPVQSSKKRKQRRPSNSLSLIDQWSKRRSGRRPGRKVEEKEESNLALRFQSFLPETLMPNDLEAHIAKANKKRSVRNPIDVLTWTEDSMDTMELYHFFQERDAKDEHQRERRPLTNDDLEQIVAKENYFGKDGEFNHVTHFIEKNGAGTKNVLELMYEFIRNLVEKDSYTWPRSLVATYIEAFECIRKHFPYQSALDASIPSSELRLDALSSLLYCEFCVDSKQLTNQKNITGSDEYLMSAALGQLMLLGCQNRLFSSFHDLCRIMIRFHWLKVHLFLIEENPTLAINSLRDVLCSLELLEIAENHPLQGKSDIECTRQNDLDENDVQNSHCSIMLINSASSYSIAKSVEIHEPEYVCKNNSKVISNSTKSENVINEVLVSTSCEPSIKKPSECSSPSHVVDSENCDKESVALGDKKLGEAMLDQSFIVEKSIRNKEEKELTPDQASLDCKILKSQVSGVEDVTSNEKLLKSETETENYSPEGLESDLRKKENEKIEDNTNQTEKIQKKEEAEEIPMSSGTVDLQSKDEVQKQDCTSSGRQNFSVLDIKVCLPNALLNRTINKSTAQKLLLSLTRQQQLSEVDELYKNQQFEALSGTLTECFKFCAQQADVDSATDENEVDNLPDRPTQMAMLLDSLWQLKRYSDCFYWTEACLHEAFNRYLNCSESDSSGEDQQMWATTIERLLAGLEACLKVGGLSHLEKLPKTCLTRLVQTLTSILCQQLEKNESSLEMAIECVTPWVVLYRVVFFEEQHQVKRPDVIPSFMRVLFTAHEYMARNSRCCLNEGILLNLILEVVVPATRSPELSGVRCKLNHYVEQAIFCLYGHPKKARDSNRKKLQDHKVPLQPELTWERSLLLLKFYEPDELPSFDSGTKISADEEQLFLRISQLVPTSYNINKLLSKMKAYVMGKTDLFPQGDCPLSPEAHNLFYLIADYYLKTYKWEQAVKYYMLDVSINSLRFDSWAGMALARTALLTTQINSCDALSNDLQLQRKTKAQRCFQKALDLDPDHATMWIEYGNFAYILHSFCSRLLKIETDSLSLEMFTKVEEEKDKMLSLTETCFKSAEKLGQDERWLQQYMLGKVAEKRGEKPLVFLRHYRAAAKLLHESNAEYPSSLNYDPPQTYAFEAHEVHYRIHASILKILESLEGKPLDNDNETLFKDTLVEAASSPFMAQSASLAQTILANLQTNSTSPTNKRISVEPLSGISKKHKANESLAINVDVNREMKQSNSCSLQNITMSSENSNVRSSQSVSAEEKFCNQMSSKTVADQISSLAPPKPCLLHRKDEKEETLNHNPSLTAVENEKLLLNQLVLPPKSTPVSVSSMNYDCQVGLKSSLLKNGDGGQKPEENSKHVELKSMDVNPADCYHEESKKSITLSEKKIGLAEGNKYPSTSSDSCGSSSSTPLNSFGSETGRCDGVEKKTTSVVEKVSDQSADKDARNVIDEINVQSSNICIDIDSLKHVKSKQSDRKRDTVLSGQSVLTKSSVVLDHSFLIKPCLIAMEECLVRYPRHYKSFYRLCHYYFRSKKHKNLKKCRQLLLGEYRVAHAHKLLNGLFKYASINTMFNDVWRIPVEEVDRAGSFASHMSRCVVLLMELLRDLQDHCLLLKLSIFLKKDPEKKDKKYLRDNERVDLSKQALGMCFTALRGCMNQIKTENEVIDLYPTVKEGIKELPHKEAFFKNILSDAYKKTQAIKTDVSMYDVAAEFCQNGLNLRKTLAQAKAAQAAQSAQAAQASQAAQTAQLSNMVSPSLFNTIIPPRFPNATSSTILRGPMGSPIFLPKVRVSRGRGRPPKAQRYNNPMHWLGLTGAINQEQILQMVQQEQQRQRLQQQQSVTVPTSQSSFVTDIAKDRPSISITAFPANKGMGAPHVTIANSNPSVSTSPGVGRGGSDIIPQASSSGVDNVSLSALIQANSMPWQRQPSQHSVLRPPTSQFTGGFNPRNNFGSSPVHVSNSYKRGSMRPRGPRSILPGNPAPSIFQQQRGRPYIPRSKVNAPVDYFLRLPELQVEQRLQTGSPGSNPSKTFIPSQKPNEASISKQQVNQISLIQKTTSQNVIAMKPSVSISKVFSSPKLSSGPSGQESQKGHKDPSVDIITLD